MFEKAILLSNYATDKPTCTINERWAALRCAVVCRGGSTKAGEAGWINILVKKAASVVWLNVTSLEAQAEGVMTTKLNSI